jgi:hypothetical protein
VLATSVAFAAAWGALTFFVVPRGLGPWFWWSLVIWPWVEVSAYLAERAYRRNGADSWPRKRPVRDAALAGLATVTLIVAIAFVGGFGVGEALVTGAICGAVVFAIAVTFDGLRKRGHV